MNVFFKELGDMHYPILDNVSFHVGKLLAEESKGYKVDRETILSVVTMLNGLKKMKESLLIVSNNEKDMDDAFEPLFESYFNTVEYFIEFVTITALVETLNEIIYDLKTSLFIIHFRRKIEEDLTV